MLRRLQFIYLIFAVAVLYACNGKENKANQIPVSEFFKIPDKSNFKISPDGKYVSYLKKYNRKQELYIRSLADEKEIVAASFSNYFIRDYNWTYNNQIVFSQDIHDQHPIFVLDVASLKVRKILSETKAFVRILINRSRQTPDVITIAMNKRDTAVFDVYRLNIKNGELKPCPSKMDRATQPISQPNAA